MNELLKLGVLLTKSDNMSNFEKYYFSENDLMIYNIPG